MDMSLQAATLIKMYVRHKLYLYEEVMGGGLRVVPAGLEMRGYAGKTLYISEAVSLWTEKGELESFKVAQYPGFLRLTNLEIHADRLFAFLLC